MEREGSSSDRRAPVVRTVGFWLAGGIAGAGLFWLVQVVSGGPTITDFMGAQIVSGGGYPERLAPLIGWAVHLGVSVSYAFLFGALVLALDRLASPTRAALTFVAALALGAITAITAPPAISVTISLLSGQGWPRELFPLNTELGLPFLNHITFFVLNWVIQALEG